MKTLLIGKIRKVVLFYALMASLAILVETGRPYAYQAYRNHRITQICAEMGQLQASHDLKFPDQPLRGQVLLSGCEKSE